MSSWEYLEFKDEDFENWKICKHCWISTATVGRIDNDDHIHEFDYMYQYVCSGCDKRLRVIDIKKSIPSSTICENYCGECSNK